LTRGTDQVFEFAVIKRLFRSPVESPMMLSLRLFPSTPKGIRPRKPQTNVLVASPSLPATREGSLFMI